MYVRTKVVLFALGALLIPHFAVAQDEDIVMSVRNRTGENLTVFAYWDTRNRSRLGDLRPNQTREFETEYRGQRVTLEVQIQGDRNRIGGNREEDFADIGAGASIEFQILSTDPLDLLFRLTGTAGGGVVAGGAEGEPRATNYTVASQLAIQNAQSTADDALRATIYRDALVAINEGLADDGDNPMAYLHLGIVHAGLKEYDAAADAFTQAETLYPAYFDEEGGTGAFRLNAWLDAYNDAIARLDAQDPEGALALFDMANTLYDRRAEAYLNIGVTAASIGDLDSSIEGWRGAIRVIESPDGNPGDEATRQTWDNEFWIMAQSNLGRLLSSRGEAAEAVAIFEAILARDPDNAEARSNLALALASSGQGADALAIFDAILASDNAPPLDYFNAGVSLYGAEELDKAVTAFEKTVAASPNYRDALQNLAQTLNQLENYEAQVPYSARLVEIDPFNDYAYLLHARALVQVGQSQEGVAVMEVMQALPFLVTDLQLQPLGSGARVQGFAVNKALAPGTSIDLRFTFYDNNGTAVGTADTSVAISDPEVAHQFAVTYEGEMQVLGYSYEQRQ